MSSSRPGASPTNMMRAPGLPSANTSRVAVDFSAQPSKVSISARSASSEGAVRAASRADWMAASGAAGSARAAGVAAAAAGRVLTSWAGGRFPGRRHDVGIGQPVDRLVRQRAVDPGLEIKGQQLLDGRGGSQASWLWSATSAANLERLAPLRNAFRWLFSAQKSETTGAFRGVLNRPEPDHEHRRITAARIHGIRRRDRRRRAVRAWRPRSG